jgi:hypothetical protein
MRRSWPDDALPRIGNVSTCVRMFGIPDKRASFRPMRRGSELKPRRVICVEAPLPGRTTWRNSARRREILHRLVTKVDLPGPKKEDVKVEVTDGISRSRGSASRKRRRNPPRNRRNLHGQGLAGSTARVP